MAKIRVIRGGCGISYKDKNGTARHALRTPEHGPFVCDDAQAARLVSLGVAVYVNEQQAAPEPKADPAVGGEPEKTTGHLDPEQLEAMEYNELKKLAADMGVTPKGKKKADLIEAITAAEVEPGDEDELPELGAADPE